MLSLYERGAMQSGLYRGLVPAITYTVIGRMVQDSNLTRVSPNLGLIFGTLLINPIANLQMLKQVVKGPQFEPASYT